jgi:hypothetical protein
MTARRVGRLPRNVPFSLIAAFAVILSAVCVSPVLAQGVQPEGPPVVATPEADIVSGWLVQQYAVLGPKRIQSVSPKALLLQSGASPIQVTLEGKNVQVIDRLGNPVTLDQLKPDVTVRLAAKGDHLVIMIVPTLERTDVPTGEGN